MNNWSDEARNELERFLVAERAWLKQEPEWVDADHQEVIADLRAHVREELSLYSGETVELEHLHEVLQRVRPGFGAAEERQPSPTARTSGTESKVLKPVPTFLYALFGVFLPALALVIELTSRPFAEGALINPIPELFYAFLIALVPVMNLIMLSLERGRLGHVTMGFAGAALTTTILYSIMFLPLIPLGAIAIVFMGIGFLILSPQLSLFVTWRLVKRCRDEGAPRGALVGGILTVVVILAHAAPRLATNIGADWATDPDPAVRSRGLGLLRTIGSDKLLLHYCYGVTTNQFVPIPLFHWAFSEPPNTTDSRELYYLVTGAPFNSVTPPENVLLELEQLGWDANRWRQRNAQQLEQGGTEVAGRIEDLSLAESRIDAQIEPEAALFYMEWELEFRNDSNSPQEARAQVQLPAGSYVSRLTLWVNGEEREAAFATTGAVREAYQDVAIVRRRDPVLVTHSGTDQVLVQCFPVPASGTLRTRIGITAPLLLEADGSNGPDGVLSLPRLLERNFELSPDLAHEVWLQGRGEYLTLPDGLVAAKPGNGQFIARGNLPTAELEEQTSVVRISLALMANQSWTSEGGNESDYAVVQTISPVTREPIDRLVFVLDGGAGLEDAGEALTLALKEIPSAIEIGLIIADGPLGEIEATRDGSPSQRKTLARHINQHDFEGGINAAPSLVAAFDLAQEEPGSAVIWLHGVQPALFSGTASLRQRFQYSTDKTRIHALAAAPGINRLVAEFGHHPALFIERRSSILSEDLVRLVRELTLGEPRLEPIRERVALAELAETAQHVSQQLARLWAGDRATELQSRAGTRELGVKLAQRYHLVTQSTGAVVLETQAQFDRHRLQPVDVEDVPSVPEPEMIALLLLAGILLGFVVMRGRVLA